MIAVSSSGKSFGAIARYLALGRTGDAPERVAWSSARNVPTSDPELAARFMRATAAQNVAVEKPVYHLAIAFDPHDPVDRATMERVADRVLARLGLAEHEAIIVAHRDREHPHMHLLVNRVHPTTGLTWDRWQDRPAIQEVLRSEELALGFRRVPGGLTTEPGHHSALAQLPTERASTAPFLDHVRAHVVQWRSCTTWGQLEAELATVGLRLERSGQGLVITDGTSRAKASKVARELGMGQLGSKFGLSYDRYRVQGDASVSALEMGNGENVRLPGTATSPSLFDAGTGPSSHLPPPIAQSADVARVCELLTTYERVHSLAQQHLSAMTASRAAEARLALSDAAERRLRTVMHALERTSAAVYQDSAAAVHAIDGMIERSGIDAAVRLLRESPERFGRLQSEGQPRRWDRASRETDAAARRAARSLATELLELWNARQRHTVLRDRAGAEREFKHADAHRLAVFRYLHELPGREQLEREIGRILNRLVPREIEELRRIVTAPRFALALRIRDAIKDVALGREGESS